MKFIENKVKFSWTDVYLVCLFVWNIIFTLSNDSTLGTRFSIIYQISGGIWLLIVFLIFCKIIFYKSNYLSILASTVIIVLGYVSYYYSKCNFLLPFFVFFAGSYHVDQKKIVKTLFISNIVVFIILFGLSSSGIIENNILIRESGEVRKSFGFTHPNSLAQKVFGTMLMYIYLVFDMLTFKHLIFFGIVMLGTFFITDSNTSIIMSFFALCLFVIWIFFKNREKKLRGVLTFIMILFLMFVGSIVLLYLGMALMNTSNLSFDFIKISNTFLSRFQQMTLYLQRYNIKLFGQPLYYSGMQGILGQNQYYGLYTLDNSYLYLLLGMGIFVFIFYEYLYLKTLIISLMKNDYYIFMVLLIYAIYGLLETTMIRFSFNFSLIFLFNSMCIWQEKRKGRGKKIKFQF